MEKKAALLIIKYMTKAHVWEKTNTNNIRQSNWKLKHKWVKILGLQRVT